MGSFGKSPHPSTETYLTPQRSTKPKVLCRIAAVLFSQAISACSVQKIDMDVLNNGVSYFLGPLLNWTLVGVVKALVREIQMRG
jgi:mediator of RNA polymerase II transcription subunit 5